MTDTTRTQTTPPDRRLHRSNDRIVAGVASGLGNHLGINAWWFRFAFIVLAFFGGFGLLLYIAAWLVIPDEGQKDPIVAKWLTNVDLSDGGTIFGVVLVGAAGIIVLTQIADLSGTLVIAAVLFVVGLLLYRGDLVTKRSDGHPPNGGSDPVAPSDVVEADEAEPAATGVSSALVAPPPAPPTVTDQIADPPPEPKSPRERSALGRITIAVGLIVLAAMALADMAFDRVDVDPVHYLATAVGVLGIGLIVGGFIGRARWLIVVGVIVLPAMWMATIVPSSWDFSAGQFEHQPESIEQVNTDISHGLGQVIIDLTRLTPEELAIVGSIHAELGAGEMIVRLPPDVGTLVVAEVGFGEISGPFKSVDGIGLDIRREVGPEPTLLRLDLEVGAGAINISGTQFNPSDASEGSVIIIEGSSS